MSDPDTAKAMRRPRLLVLALLALAGCGGGVKSQAIHEVTNTHPLPPAQPANPVSTTATTPEPESTTTTGQQAAKPPAPEQPSCSELESKWNTAEAGRHESTPFSKQWNEWSSARHEAEQGIHEHACVEPKGMAEYRQVEERTGGANEE
jgi:hypothetical protein